MQPNESVAIQRSAWLWAFVCLAFGVVVAKAVGDVRDPVAILVAADSDDILRFLSVRDWLNGQGWFDMSQTGVAAEGGLVLHWSRFVDLGIASVVATLGPVVGDAAALAAAIVWWPVMLHGLLIAATAREALRSFDGWVASTAVLALVMWPMFTNGYFGPGRLDHHGVQILLLTAVVYSLLRHPGDWRASLVAGVLTAFSLAIGLETLLALGLAGAIISWRAVRAPALSALPLRAYAIALGLGAPLFFAVQTAPARWLAPQCDQLGPPLLQVLGAVAMAAIVLSFALPRVAVFKWRLGLAGVLYAAAVASGATAVLACAEGPYGSLPPGLENEIYAQISEAMPVLTLLREMPQSFHVNVLPLLTTVTIATVFWRRDTDAERKKKAGTLLVFGWFAAVATLFQMRMIVIGAAVLPLIVGYALARLMDWRQTRGQSLPSTAAFLAASLLTIFYPYAYVVSKYVVNPARVPGSDIAFASAQCRSLEVLETLRGLPEGPVLSTLNLGPSILLASGLPVLAAPYHRSPAALTNGLRPFRQGEAAFRATVDAIGADYIVLCRGDAHPGFAGDLAAGVAATGFRPIPGLAPELVVYEVVR